MQNITLINVDHQAIGRIDVHETGGQRLLAAGWLGSRRQGLSGGRQQALAANRQRVGAAALVPSKSHACLPSKC